LREKHIRSCGNAIRKSAADEEFVMSTWWLWNSVQSRGRCWPNFVTWFRNAFFRRLQTMRVAMEDWRLC